VALGAETWVVEDWVVEDWEVARPEPRLWRRRRGGHERGGQLKLALAKRQPFVPPSWVQMIISGGEGGE
jgi:hypothetical protein